MTRLEKAYIDLEKFIYWAAHKESVAGNWLLETEELISEGFLKLVELNERYPDKDYDEFLAIAKTSIVNEFRTLKGKAFKTHRKLQHESFSVELDLISPDEANPYVNSGALADNSVDLEQQTEFTIISEMSKYLDEFQKEVLSVFIGSHPRLGSMLDLHRKRLHTVYNNPKVKLTLKFVSRVVCNSVCAVKKAMKAIKLAYLKVTSSGVAEQVLKVMSGEHPLHDFYVNLQRMRGNSSDKLTVLSVARILNLKVSQVEQHYKEYSLIV